MGGEKPSRSPRQAPETGSPPRGRGKVFQHGNAAGKIGITPAWAGKSFLRPGGLQCRRDHPRVGGEKPICAFLTGWTWGSPPRGRGKVFEPNFCQRRRGITPAWAGKSQGFGVKLLHNRDHPRVGGEKLAGRYVYSDPSGSPPRGRGKDLQSPESVDHLWITPAWAGKSCTSSPRNI